MHTSITFWSLLVSVFHTQTLQHPRSYTFNETCKTNTQFETVPLPKDFSNKQLRPWISTQRSHFRFRQENKPSQLTDERVELLNGIGFPWKTKEDWQTRFNELLLYFHENGNLQVPKVYDVSNLRLYDYKCFYLKFYSKCIFFYYLPIEITKALSLGCLSKDGITEAYGRARVQVETRSN